VRQYRCVRGMWLVTVRDYNTLNHLRWTLETTDTSDADIVVMEARLTGYGSADRDLAMEQIFSDYEQTLFTKAVSIAGKLRKTISLLVVPARDVWSAIVQTANALESFSRGVRNFQQMTGEETGVPPGPGLGGHAGAEEAVSSLWWYAPTPRLRAIALARIRQP